MATIHRLSTYRTKRILEKFAMLSGEIDKQNLDYSHSVNGCKGIVHEVVNDHRVLIDKCEMFLEKIKQSREFCSKCEEAWQKNNISEMVAQRDYLSDKK